MRAPEPHDDATLVGEVVRPAGFVATTSLYIASVAGILLVVTGILCARPQAVALSLPFVVHAVRGWSRRPQGRWRLAPSQTSAEEGTTVSVEARMDGCPAVVTIA